MKKIIIALILFFKLSLISVMAYNTNDWVNIYYQGSDTWQNYYNVPEGKDLIINFIYADSKDTAELFISDNYTALNPNILGGGSFSDNKNNVFIVVKDSLWLIDSASTNNYTIMGILYDEGQDISKVINGESEKEEHFTREQINNLLIIEVALSWLFGFLYFTNKILE